MRDTTRLIPPATDQPHEAERTSYNTQHDEHYDDEHEDEPKPQPFSYPIHINPGPRRLDYQHSDLTCWRVVVLASQAHISHIAAVFQDRAGDGNTSLLVLRGVSTRAWGDFQMPLSRT